MPSNGYPAYANHPWHHYLAAGPASLLELVLPFLVIALFALLVATGRWAAVRARAQLSRRKSRAASLRALTRRAHALPPVLASDLERDETASRVSQAVGEGRLSIEEGVERIDAVLPQSPPSRACGPCRGSALSGSKDLYPAFHLHTTARRVSRRRSSRGSLRRAGPGRRWAMGAVAARRGHSRRVDAADSSLIHQAPGMLLRRLFFRPPT